MANLETVHCLFQNADAAWKAVQALKNAAMEPQVRLVAHGDDDLIEVSTECFTDCDSGIRQQYSDRLAAGDRLLLVRGCDDPEKARSILKEYGASFLLS